MSSPRRGGAGATIAALAVGGCAIVLLGAAPAALAGWAAPPDGGGRLSDEARRSYWAHPARVAKARARPNPAGRVITRLRLATELGSPEVYLVLSRRLDPRGDWLKVRLPMRPNGTTGWVRESALGALHLVTTQLVISRRKLRATLFNRGKRVWRADVGIGRAGSETPKGRYYVRERLRLGDSSGPYGSFAFGTSAYSPELTDWPDGGVVGIHGTNEPELIPGRISHGCVRVTNDKVQKLRKRMSVGTPVWIR
jgi:L,D-transpeptidase catalytic domain